MREKMGLQRSLKSDLNPRGWRRNNVYHYCGQQDGSNCSPVTQLGPVNLGDKAKGAALQVMQVELNCNSRRRLSTKPNLEAAAAANSEAGGQSFFSLKKGDLEENSRQFNMLSSLSMSQQLEPDLRLNATAQGCSFRRLQSNSCISPTHLGRQKSTTAKANIKRSHFRAKSKANFNPQFLLLSLFGMVLAVVAMSFAFEATAETQPIYLDQQHQMLTRSNDNHQSHKRVWSVDNSDSTQSLSRVFPSQQQLVKKSASPLDHVSSADLPAEFRGEFDDTDGDLATLDNQKESPAPKEQSKLAKLCQQTSSVLASVLPAPFGGHKRSILCQFFGQVPQDVIQRPNNNRLNLPIKIPSHREPESIAVIQQPQQPPITMMTDGRHPIQLVVEQFQQQQQQQIFTRGSPLSPLSRPHPVSSLMSPMVQDLKGSASVLDYSYHQKLEPPASMHQQLKNSSLVAAKSVEKPLKFNAPISAASFKPLSSQMPSSPLMSTSGWRIFNHSLDTTSPQPLAFTTVAPFQNIVKNQTFSSTTGNPRPSNIAVTEQPNSSGQMKQSSSAKGLIGNPKIDSNTRKKELEGGNISISISSKSKTAKVPERNDNATQLLVMGKPPSFSGNKQSSVSESQLATTTAKHVSTLGKRTEALKYTTKSMEDDQSSGVRTIEVDAQQSNNSSPLAEFGKNTQLTMNTTSTTTTTTQMPPSQLPGSAKIVLMNDLNQVQKREELVIASINNLTRIAFGNHLRDTVKVINKLIDQQAEIFSVQNKVAKKDPMTSAESRIVETSASGDKVTSKLRKSISSNKSSTNSRDGKENQISIPTASKSRQKHSTPSGTTTPSQFKQQIKSTKKPKKQTRTQQQASTVGSQATTRSSYTSSSLVTSSVLVTNPKKMASFNFQKLSTPSAAIGSEFRTPRSGASLTSNERPPLSSANESRRLPAYASSRSLALDSTRKTTNPMSFDHIATATMTDIRRDKPLWQARSQLSTTAKISTPVATSTTTARPSLASSSIKWKPQTSTGTTHSWLLPDKKLPHHYDMPSSKSVLSTKEEPPRTTMDTKQTLVMNKIDNPIVPVKLDSLTTLKMSLATQAAPSTLAISTSTSLSPPSSIAGSSSHSRWIPTSTVTLAPSSPTTTTTAPAITTTTPAPQAITTSSPQATSAPVEPVQPTSRGSADPSSMAPIVEENATSLSDLNEARASDSISKYTTHWNEANELLATTNRRLFPQPLPQTAQTGEFFSAETIAIWPERYQTMITQALDGQYKTTPPIETTRRNGETYVTNNPLARHRFNANISPVADPTRTTPIANNFLANMTSVTILPPNHKLTATTKSDSEQNFVTYSLQPQPTIKADATVVARQTLPATGVAYTLVGPYSESATDIPEFSGENLNESGAVKELKKYPNALEDLLLPGDVKIRLNSTGSLLRPPYLGPLDGKQQTSLVSSMSDHDLQAISKPHVARKLHELLVPSTRSFVGTQNPLNQQRFNLSALKFLAQNILGSAPAANYNDSINWPENYLSQQSDNSSSPQQRSILDMLGGSLPYSYYEMLLNDSSNGISSVNRNTTGRTIIGRAGNLLNDLKQLEQKKAAAILAAIRYQVPSPLVRPWDLTSDSMSNLSQMRDRLDESGDDYIRDSLLFAQASRAAIKAAMAQQRVIPRNELEARLNGSKHFILSEESISERRSDTTHDSSLYTVDKDQYVVANGSRHDDDDIDEPSEADYSSSHAIPLASNKFSRGRNFTRTLIDKLLGNAPRTDLNLTSGDLNGSSESDLDPVVNDPQASTLKPSQGTSTNGSDQYPKYIRFLDYRTWVGRPASSESQVESHPHKHHLPSSAIAAKLRENMARLRTTTDSSLDIMSEKIDKISRSQSGRVVAQSDETSTNFDCTGRQSGFHPNTDTACQTFYHCSSTGHLLTFNCPQQTRFDEKSLKCGPWFEVPCDLGRSKQKRLAA